MQAQGRFPPLWGLLLVVSGCVWNAAGQTGCKLAHSPSLLPEELHESSGVAASRLHPGILWTHNDGRRPLLWAVDTLGTPLARISIRGRRMRDWEDLAVGDCPSGTCLYLADTGDNQEVREQSQILRLPEPDTLTEGPLLAQVFPIRLPDGPRDVEAIFVLPGEQIFLISKGRNHPVTVYLYPPPLRAEEVVTLETVQTLSEGSRSIGAQITGADASPDGRVVAVRSYESLSFYRVEEGRLVALEGGKVALGTLREPQGEAVGFGPAGLLFLTTEAGFFGGAAALRVLECNEVLTGQSQK